MRDTRSYLITGANGFIGAWIVETLYLAGNHNVRAGIRTWSSAARVARFPIDIVSCDVTDESQVESAARGANIIVHCATGNHDVIVEGTRNVLNVAFKLGINRVVHLSTAEVYGKTRGTVSEEWPLELCGDEYADAKIQAERHCLEYQKRGLPVTILRPSIVYGPFSDWWIAKFAERLQSGNWGIFKGYGEGLCNAVYVSDLVSAVLLASTSERAIGEAFNINGPERVTWNEYFRRFNYALGLDPLQEIEPGRLRLKSVAMEPIRGVADFVLGHFRDPIFMINKRVATLGRAMRATQRKVKTTPALHELNLYNRKAYYTSTKAEALLGYYPSYDLETGLVLCASWLKQLGVLSGYLNTAG